MEQRVLPDLLQGLLAEDMLGFAGVLGGNLLVHAQLHKEVRQQAVAAVNALCDLASRLFSFFHRFFSAQSYCTKSITDMQRKPKFSYKKRHRNVFRRSGVS